MVCEEAEKTVQETGKKGQYLVGGGGRVQKEGRNKGKKK